MKVYFVGIHNKGDKKTLCSSTRTGKIIDGIIKRLPEGIETIKTNLFDIDHYPDECDNIEQLMTEWKLEYNPKTTDIIILLGSSVHKFFCKRFQDFKIVKLPHPASIFYTGKTDGEYIDNAINLINK